MAYSNRTIGIIIASTLSVVLIVVAVLISGPLPFRTNSVNAESTHQLLVEYAAKDTDTDGLPDWEEALYGTDPANPHSLDPKLTDGDAVAQGLAKPKFANATSTPVDLKDAPGVDVGPTTVTDQFAREFFGQYLSQHSGTQPSPEEVATFVEQGLQNLSTDHAQPNAYNQGQVHVAGSGTDALISYAASAETVFAKNNPGTEKAETDYFSDAILKNDASAIKQIAKIGASYTATAKAYMAISVPSEAASPHLAVANALAHLGTDITDMAAMNTDPLRGYLGLANYENDAPALVSALSNMDAVFHAESAVVTDGTTGSSYYAALERSAAGAPPPVSSSAAKP